MGETEAMIEYILVNNRYRSSFKNVKVISGEELVNQHCFLSMDMVFKKKVKRKVIFRKKLRLWRLRKSKMKEQFAEWVNNKWGGNEDWGGLKRKLLDVASEVVVILKTTPGILKRGDGIKMWIWLCSERGSYLRFGNRIGMRKIGRNIVRQKKDAKRVVYTAMDHKTRETVEKVNSRRDGRELFRIPT